MAALKGKRRPTTSGSVREALRARFAAPAWAFFEEVGNATGFGCNRHADGVAMSLWPSRGLELHGIEIKVTRADWLSELKNPKKADDIAKYCDRWWLTVGSADIVRAGELPPTWGLLVLEAGKLACKTEAPKLPAEPLGLSFVAALLRKIHEAHSRLLSSARVEGFERGQALGPDGHRTERQRLADRVTALEKALADFETKSGIKIDTWGAGDLGAALRKFMTLSSRWDPEPTQKLTDAAEELERHAKELRKHVATLEKQQAIAVSSREAADG